MAWYILRHKGTPLEPWKFSIVQTDMKNRQRENPPTWSYQTFDTPRQAVTQLIADLEDEKSKAIEHIDAAIEALQEKL